MSLIKKLKLKKLMKEIIKINKFHQSNQIQQIEKILYSHELPKRMDIEYLLCKLEYYETYLFVKNTNLYIETVNKQPTL